MVLVAEYLWLKLKLSNNNHKVIGKYIGTIKELNLIPKVIRADRRIENVTICSIYGFFLRNGTDNHLKDKSFIYAHSTVNERIESSQLILAYTRFFLYATRL